MRRARVLGLGSRHFAYIVPRDGFTLGQYMLGRTLGAHAVRPAFQVTNGVRPGQLRAGVVLEIRTGTGGSTELRRVLTALRTSGFEGVAVGPLVGARR